MCHSTLYRLCIVRRSAQRSPVVWKATACTRGHGGWGWGVNIQLSSLNFETIAGGELSQLADYCLTLKISVSTRTNEATFCFTETMLPLMQTASRFLQLGLPPNLILCLFLLQIPCNKQLNYWGSGESFPDLTSVRKLHLYCTVWFYTCSEM